MSRCSELFSSEFGRTYDGNFLSTFLAYVIVPAHNGLGQQPPRRLLALAGADLAGIDCETVVIDHMCRRQTRHIFERHKRARGSRTALRWPEALYVPTWLNAPAKNPSATPRANTP